MNNLLRVYIAEHLKSFILSLFALVIVSMAIIFYYATHLYYGDALKTDADEIRFRTLKHASKQIVTSIQGEFMLLETLANRNIMRGIYGEKKTTLAEKLEMLKSEQERLKNLGFEQFGIIDKQGFASYTDHNALFIGFQEHILQAFDGKSTLSTIQYTHNDTTPVLHYAVPIKDFMSHTVTAVLCASFNVQRLSEMLNSFSCNQTNTLFIFDAHGNILAHSDFLNVFHTPSLPKIEQLYDSASFQNTIIPALMQGAEGRDSFYAQQQQWDITYTSIPSTQWSIAIVTPQEIINAKSNTLKKSLVLLFAIILLMTMLLAYWMANTISRYHTVLENEKKEHHAELIATKNNYATTLNALPDLLFEMGLDGTYYDYHSPYDELLAAPPEVLLKSNVHHILPTEAANICLNALQEANEIGYSRGKVIKLLLKHGVAWFELSIAKKPSQENEIQPRFILLSRDITERKRAEERNAYLANFDPLTTLPNRIQLENYFKYFISTAKRNNATFAVLFIDLDLFKKINDSLGHHIGDKILIEASKRLLSLMRESDIVSRFGGDEFIALLPNTDQEGVSEVAQKILLLMQTPYIIEEHTLHMTASIGIALYPEDGVSMDTLSKHADMAMYQTKKHGRNHYSFFQKDKNSLPK